jgi:hypothetical protein
VEYNLIEIFIPESIDNIVNCDGELGLN